MPASMRDTVSVCRCGHTRRGHFGGSGRLRDAGTCKTKECRCRSFSGQSMEEAATLERPQEHGIQR